MRYSPLLLLKLAMFLLLAVVVAVAVVVSAGRVLILPPPPLLLTKHDLDKRDVTYQYQNRAGEEAERSPEEEMDAVECRLCIGSCLSMAVWLFTGCLLHAPSSLPSPPH